MTDKEIKAISKVIANLQALLLYGQYTNTKATVKCIQEQITLLKYLI